MEGPAIVVPMGRYGGFSKMACRRSPMCRCCGQSLLCLRVPVSRRRVSRICSESSGAGDRRLRSGGEMCCREGANVGGLRRNSGKKENRKKLMTGIAVCEYGKAYDAGHRPDGFWSDAETLRATPDRRSGGAHSLREEWGGDLYKSDGHDVGAFSYRDGEDGVANSSADDSAWAQGGPPRRKMAGKSIERVLHSSDERSSPAGHFSNSWTRQSHAEAGGETFQGSRIPDSRRDGFWDHGGDHGNSVRHSTSRQPTSNIPSSELTKIEELRFSGDMQEGDSGTQVLNLQRALFWLGHLRGLSLTGYFGPETTRALREFHYSHGIPSTGMWGFQSRHMLWKHLHPEPHQEHSVQEIPKKSKLEQRKFPDFNPGNSWLLVKNLSEKVIDKGLHASRALQQWQSNTCTELVASVSSLPHPTWDSQRVGVLLLIIVVLSSITKVVHFCFGRVHGQPVKKRVMSWRTGVDLRRPARKPTHAPLEVQQVQHKPSEGERFLRYVQSYLPQKSTEKLERFGCNLLDCLVLFDGQVLRGHHPNNSKSTSRTRMELGNLNRNKVQDVTFLQKSSPVVSPEQLHLSELKMAAQKVDGFDQFQKLEVDPPRKISLNTWSPMQSEKPFKLTGGEQLQTGGDCLRDVSHPRWAAWLSYFFPLFFFNKEKLTSSSSKSSSRRAVVRTNSSRQAKALEKGVAGDLGSYLNSSKFEGGSLVNNETQKQREENELELTKRVEELCRTVESVEQTRVAAVRALAEEKMHNLELEVKIRRQKEAAASLEEEVRVLKDSHEALLTTLKKKYSSPAAARAAAALLYQNWDPSDSSARV